MSTNGSNCTRHLFFSGMLLLKEIYFDGNAAFEYLYVHVFSSTYVSLCCTTDHSMKAGRIIFLCEFLSAHHGNLHKRDKTAYLYCSL